MITKLKYFLDKSGYKQQFVAHQIGMNHAHFSRVVAGQRSITPDVKSKLAKILKVKPSDLEGEVKV